MPTFIHALRAFGSLSDSSEPWWIAAWEHRKQIIFTNDLNETLSDLQVRINLQYEPGMEPDFSDVRFIIGGSRSLSYWKQTYWLSSEAVFWVSIPDIATEGNQTVYIYYGNPLALDESNGTAVFEFFDDFAAGLDKWNLFGLIQPNTFEDQGFHDGWGYENGAYSARSGGWSKDLIDVSDDARVEFRVKQDYDQILDMFYDIGIGKLQSNYTTNLADEAYCSVGLYACYPDANNYLENATTYKAYPEVLVEEASNDFEFHNYVIECHGLDNTVSFFRDGKIVTELVAQHPPFDELPLYIFGTNYHRTNYLDYIFVCRHPLTNPNIAVGVEETLYMFQVFVEGRGQMVQIVSDSIIGEFQFNQSLEEITFSACCQEKSTCGFCNITIPKGLLWAEAIDAWAVRIDNSDTPLLVSNNGTHSFIYIDLVNGAHVVTISDLQSIPELPQILSPLPLFVALSIPTAYALRSTLRRRKR